MARQVELLSWPEDHRVWLGELSGQVEQRVTSTDTLAAIELLDGVLVAGPGATIEPGQAAGLDAAARDLLLAEVYHDVYGNHVESTWVCEQCRERFDLHFELRRFVDAAVHEIRRASRPFVREDGLHLADGTPFRLPTGEDELAVSGLKDDRAQQALYAACVDGPGASRPEWAEALAHCSAVLDRDLDAVCVQCGHGHQVSFSMQHFLLSALIRERAQLRFQVHCLARGYGWSLNEILSLGRTDRLAYVRLLQPARSGQEASWS